MTTANDLWDELGSLADEEASHVLARLFATYEQQEQCNPGDEATILFFRNLATALNQVCECNLNRR